MSAATINPHEAAHFGALAADWWDPHGSSAMLHKLNPVRLAYVRDQIDAHWQVDARERYALAGRSAIDVGCGAGLLAEPLRSEEHTSELQSLMRISYAVFCLKKTKTQ